jgi:tetraacyldisaccharide-1-P 4'-kinase
VRGTQPILSIVRMVPWASCGYRYVIAAGIGHPLLFRAVFRDTCDVFPDHPVIVVAEYANQCEVVAAHRYTALRPVVQGW